MLRRLLRQVFSGSGRRAPGAQGAPALLAAAVEDQRHGAHGRARRSRRRGSLEADPARVARWRERLAGLGDGLKVGISWRGGTAATRTSRRSIELERWLPVLRMPGAKFVSLQYTREYDALAAFSRTHDVGVTAWPEAIESFEETAALSGGRCRSWRRTAQSGATA